MSSSSSDGYPAALQRPPDRQMVAELFQMFDADCDGVLSEAEYKAFLKGILLWGTEEYTEDDYEFKFPEECAQLGGSADPGVTREMFDRLYATERKQWLGVDFDDAHSTPRIDPNARSACGFVGLSNQGATCYMNSLLQALFMIPELRQALFQWQHTEGCDPPKAECVPYQLQRLFVELQSSDRRDVETKSLTSSFGWTEEDAFEQHDVNELFNVLADALENAFKGTAGDGVIQSLFEGEMNDYLRCTVCNFSQKRNDVFKTLDVAIRAFNQEPIESVQAGLERHFTPETLDGDNRWECPKCQKKVDAKKGLIVSKMPYLLTLGLSRFTYDWMADERVKLNDRVTFQTTLDVASFLDRESEWSGDAVEADDEDSNEGCGAAGTQDSRGEGVAGAAEQESTTRRSAFGKDGATIMARGYSAVQEFSDGADVGLNYELFAILIHSGGAAAGHYYAFIMDFESRDWFEFNDEKVTGPLIKSDFQKAFGGAVRRTTNFGTFMGSTSAYMLMYRRKEQDVNLDLASVVIPDQLLASVQTERELRKHQRREEAKERAAARVQARAAKNAVPFAACYQSKLKVLTIDKDSPMVEVQARIYAELGVDATEDCSRICALQPKLLSKYMPGTGSTATVVIGNTTPLGELDNVVNKVVLVETKEPGAAWGEPGDAFDRESNQIFFTDVGEPEYVHSLAVACGSSLAAVKSRISTALELPEDETVELLDAFGDPVNGVAIQTIAGDSRQYSAANVKKVISAAQANGESTPAQILAGLTELPTAEVSEASLANRGAGADDCGDEGDKDDADDDVYLCVHNLSPYEVKVRLKLEANGVTKRVLKQTLDPVSADSSPCYEDWHRPGQLFTFVIAGLQPPLTYTVGKQNKQHAFVCGSGPDSTAVVDSVVMFQVNTKKKIRPTEATQHTVPIYMYKGCKDDTSGYLFDLEVDENMPVTELKELLAQRMMQEDVAAFPNVNPRHLRVREFASNDPNWLGNVFVDSQKVIDPVSSFVGGEKFAVSLLDGPDLKTDHATMVVITVFWFDKESYSLSDQHFELVINKGLPVAALRDRIAAVSDKELSSGDISLASANRVKVGAAVAALTGTVADMDALQWDWDLMAQASGSSAQTALIDVHDQHVFYYADRNAEPPELSEERKDELKKKAVLSSRRKRNEEKTVFRPESGVVIRGAGVKVNVAPNEGNK